MAIRTGDLDMPEPTMMKSRSEAVFDKLELT
jgi:hypothetical protein